MPGIWSSSSWMLIGFLIQSSPCSLSGWQGCSASRCFFSWGNRLRLKYSHSHLWLNPLVSDLSDLLRTTPLSDSMLLISTIESNESVSDPLEGLIIALLRELWDPLRDKLPGAEALNRKYSNFSRKEGLLELNPHLIKSYNIVLNI